ncbi:MAG: hypothetical protein U1E14_04980 [Geminicoccaceae bacterium]
MKVVMVPSVSGGIGHISRAATLARALRRLDPSAGVEMVLDAERLRPFNIDAALGMGYRPRLMPPRTPESRGPIVRACLGDADVIVDDVARYLLPLRHHVPDAAWVSVAMHPIGDELFMDWPLMAQMDAVFWPYPQAVAMPEELAIVADRVVRTGPFLDVDDVPDRATARHRLHLPSGPLLVYAPRGFPFGAEFGHRVLGALFAAAARLRQTVHPDLRLQLLAVRDPAELRSVDGVPAELPPWVSVLGIQSQADTLLFQRAADVLVAEGTSTIHEGAALCTPMLIVPGPIREIELLAAALDRAGAAAVVPIERVSAERLAGVLEGLLGEDGAGMAVRAAGMVRGGGGVMQAARTILEIHARRRGGR